MTEEFSKDELLIIHNALNEILHGPNAIEDREFSSRIGASREEVVQLLSKMNKKTLKSKESHPCPCCKHRTMGTIGEYEICPICHWEDDPSQSANPDLAGGANVLSLNQAIAAWEENIKQ